MHSALSGARSEETPIGVMPLWGPMKIEDIRNVKDRLYQIASQNGIRKIFVVGSVAREESEHTSDVDFFIELEKDASALGVGAFQYEAQQLLGVEVNVIPDFALSNVSDKNFERSVKEAAIEL
jgi:hypothetical protein